MRYEMMRDRRLLAILSALALVTVYVVFYATTSDCIVNLGEYNGPRPYAVKETISSRCLVSSRWMQLRQHKLLSPQGDVIDDWLFIDYHDRINVLAEVGGDKGTGVVGKFQVMRQKKYALEDRTSTAVVGGIIEAGETAEVAARRELEEELGLVTTELVFLGRFRTDVNRGMGWVNSFLARRCTPSAKAVEQKRRQRRLGEGGEVGKADVERQQLVQLSFQELRQEATRGSFIEVQWSNTVSLAILHIFEENASGID